LLIKLYTGTSTDLDVENFNSTFTFLNPQRTRAGPEQLASIREAVLCSLAEMLIRWRDECALSDRNLKAR